MERCTICDQERSPDQFEDGLRCKLCVEDEETKAKVAVIATAAEGFAIEHMLTELEARVEINGRKFTVKVDNGSNIWDDGPYPRTETEEFHL